MYSPLGNTFVSLRAAEVPLPAVADPPGGVFGALWRLVAPVRAVRGEVAVCGCRNAPATERNLLCLFF